MLKKKLTKEEELEQKFEKEAHKRLGGSMVYVSKKKVNWNLKPKNKLLSTFFKKIQNNLPKLTFQSVHKVALNNAKKNFKYLNSKSIIKIKNYSFKKRTKNALIVSCKFKNNKSYKTDKKI